MNGVSGAILSTLKKTARAVRFLIYFIVDTVALSLRPRWNEKTSGVAMMRFDAIGDFVIWLREACAYRAAYPNQKITLLCSSIVGELAKDLGYWDEVRTVNIKELRNLKKRYSILFSLGQTCFETLIHPVSSRSLEADNIARFIPAKQKICVKGDPTNSISIERWFSDNWYSKYFTRTQQTEIEFNRRFSEFLGVASCVENSSAASVKKQDLVVIGLGASFVGKMWPVDRYKIVIDWILRNTTMDIAFVGVLAERKLVDQAIESSGDDSRIRNLVGDLSLPQTFHLIEKSSFVLGNDSAIVHIASHLNIPSVCIAGGGHFGRFIPYPAGVLGPLVANQLMSCYGCDWKCSHPEFKTLQAFPCVDHVSVDSVIALSKKFLK